MAWGTTYVTVTELLPAGRPLLVATMRVLPAGLLLVAAGRVTSRWRPRGREWWPTTVLAACNFALFFPLLTVAGYRLPGGVAAAVGGLQPLLVTGLSWPLNGRRPRAGDVALGSVAALGVGMVVIRPGFLLDPVGVLAAVGANLSFSLGVVLTKHCPAPPHRLAAAGWQLLVSGVILLPLAAIIEEPPPAPTVRVAAGFAYLSLAATGLAFMLWFNGIRRLPTPAPPLLGLAAPVTGAILGWVVLGQALSPIRIAGFVVTVSAIGYGAGLRPARAGSGARRCDPVLDGGGIGGGALPVGAATGAQVAEPADPRAAVLGLDHLGHDLAEQGVEGRGLLGGQSREQAGEIAEPCAGDPGGGAAPLVGEGDRPAATVMPRTAAGQSGGREPVHQPHCAGRRQPEHVAHPVQGRVIEELVQRGERGGVRPGLLGCRGDVVTGLVGDHQGKCAEQVRGLLARRRHVRS